MLLHKIKTKLLFISALLIINLGLATPVFASASPKPLPSTKDASSSTTVGGSSSASSKTEVCKGAGLTANEDGTGCESQGSAIQKVIKTAINIFSVIIGIVAVVMIIAGGLKYITSGGNTEKTTSAKNTILYAVVGLVIVAFAQIIVRFVLTKTHNAPLK